MDARTCHLALRLYLSRLPEPEEKEQALGEEVYMNGTEVLAAVKAGQFVLLGRGIAETIAEHLGRLVEVEESRKGIDLDTRD
jgi:hypothetical protein